MIADARLHLYESAGGLFFPVLAIFVTVTGFNLLGDGLRRTLDVRLINRGRAMTDLLSVRELIRRRHASPDSAFR